MQKKKKKKKERVIPGCMQLELERLSEKKRREEEKLFPNQSGDLKMMSLLNFLDSGLWAQSRPKGTVWENHRQFSPTFFFPGKRVNVSQREFNFPPPVEARENYRSFAKQKKKNKSGRKWLFGICKTENCCLKTCVKICVDERVYKNTCNIV